MSDEQRKDEESEVEAHRRAGWATDEPGDEAESDDEVEAHRSTFNRASANRPDNY